MRLLHRRLNLLLSRLGRFRRRRRLREGRRIRCRLSGKTRHNTTRVSCIFIRRHLDWGIRDNTGQRITIHTELRIVMLRKAAGLTVHDLQMAFGFNSPQAIYKWQNGTALPTVDNLIALAALLHVRIDDILITDHSVA